MTAKQLLQLLHIHIWYHIWSSNTSWVKERKLFQSQIPFWFFLVDNLQGAKKYKKPPLKVISKSRGEERKSISDPLKITVIAYHSIISNFQWRRVFYRYTQIYKNIKLILWLPQAYFKPALDYHKITLSITQNSLQNLTFASSF